MTFENLMNSLSKEDYKKIQKKVYDFEYVFFDISVFNVGAVINLEFLNDIPNFQENGYSCVLYVAECHQYIIDNELLKN